MNLCTASARMWLGEVYTPGREQVVMWSAARTSSAVAPILPARGSSGPLFSTLWKKVILNFRGVCQTPLTAQTWAELSGGHHGAKHNLSVFPQKAEPETRRGGTGEKKYPET